MLSFIILLLILSSLSRPTRFWGSPFMGMRGGRRPPMGWHHRRPMGGPFGMGGGFRGGPFGRF